MPKPKSSRKNLFVIAICAVAMTVIILGLIFYKQCPYSLKQEISSQLTFLYVQTAHSGSLSVEQANGRQILTLNDVSPTTVYFSDRPNREAGHQSTAEFISDWNYGEDSFGDSPPNAALDIIGENSQSIAIVELMNAVYDAQSKTLEYEVIVLDDESNGTFPTAFDEVVLFIDSTHVDYKCDCEISADKDTCKCRYTYTLGASKTKEFRGYCANDMYPDALHVGDKRNSTSCTNSFPWFDYYSRSCTNWDPISSDKLNINVICTK